jgi:hypothetical protein
MRLNRAGFRNQIKMLNDKPASFGEYQCFGSSQDAHPIIGRLDIGGELALKALKIEIRM